MQKQIYISLLCLILAIMSSVFCVFAWFIKLDSAIFDIRFETQELKVLASIWQFEDFDKDGIYDIQKDGTNKLNEVFAIDISNAYPGQVFSYRIQVRNIITNVYMAISWQTRETINASSTNVSEILSFNCMIADASQKVYLGENNNVKVMDNSTNFGHISPVLINRQAGSFLFDFNIKVEHLVDIQNLIQTEELPITKFASKTNLSEFVNKTLANGTLFIEFRTG